MFPLLSSIFLHYCANLLHKWQLNSHGYDSEILDRGSIKTFLNRTISNLSSRVLNIRKLFHYDSSFKDVYLVYGVYLVYNLK